MRIKKYETDQFAGIRKLSVDFKGGINVVVGDNETGKSTMINGIYSTLFQPFKANMRTKSASSFWEHFSPGGSHEVCLDGTVELVVGDELVKVHKDWTTDDESSMWIDTDAIGKQSGKKAEKKLEEVMQYGAGFYSNVVFGRQNHDQEVLQWIFNATKAGEDKDIIKSRMEELYSVVNGIDIDKLDALLTSEIELLNKRWDDQRNAPALQNGQVKKWDKGKGEILEAYYAWQEIKQELESVREIIQEIQQTDKELELLSGEYQKVQEGLEYISKNETAFATKKMSKALLERTCRELRELERVQKEWPILAKEKKEVQCLMAQEYEQNLREEKRILKENIQKLEQDIFSLEKMEKNMGDADRLRKDFAKAEKLQRSIEKNKNKLCAAELVVTAKLHSDSQIQIFDAIGEKTPDATGEIQVNGFAGIHIPEVGEILVTPKDMDVEKLQQDIVGAEKELAEILGKYHVQEIEALASLLQNLQKEAARKELLKQRVEAWLSEETLEQKRDRVASLQENPDVDIPGDLQEQIDIFLKKVGERKLESAQVSVSVRLEQYQKSYESLDSLKEKVKECRLGIEKYQRELDALPELEPMGDYEEKKEGLQKRAKEILDQREALISKKSRAESEIGEMDLDLLEEEERESRTRLEKKKDRYRMLRDIQNTLQDIRSNTKGNGSAGDKFLETMNEYLSEISDNSLAAKDLDSRLDMNIQSGKHTLLSPELLSEGTKETVLLAFKLAVSQMFFEKEGGFIVLDDVLLDMDPGRRGRSAKLIQRFAEHNQVIFTTCDPTMADMLGGHRIQM